MTDKPDILHTAALRKKLKDGKKAMGLWMGISDPFAVEAIAADMPVDWVQLDMEHSGVGWRDLQMLLLGWKGSKVPCFVRAQSHDLPMLGRMLDLGVSGFIIPMVNTPEDASALVKACKYPPMGTRGFAPRRVSGHYTRTMEYVKNANEETFVMVQIEHKKAVENVEAIARTPNLDALFIGPADLSYSLGIPLEFEHPDEIAAIRKVIKAGHDAGVTVAMAVDDPAPELKRWFDEGVQMVTIGLDWMFIREGVKQRVAEVRKLMGDKV